ncbi:N-acetylmuramoyl-L-alanine amidase [Ruminococcus callidus]|uniref:N-acetylmuramoyl-L-alanine amidase n=1 Tax=Ruminococcus callidus TaxID=40519 RepID=UPI00352144FF
MAILKPDTTTTMNGVTVNEYLLTKHNPNHIAMPSASMEGKIIGVTVHNTDWISVASGTTPAEQYTRATVNGNMKDVRVHYYVDNTCAWQNLPLTLSGWHAADGSGNGNRRTIAIECIMSSAYNATDQKSEDNAAKLAAALLKKYNLSISNLYTHTHWLNVRDGKFGSVDYLNTAKNPYKTCPLYILPHWSAFKTKVQKYLTDASDAKPTVKNIYRIRKSWADAKSQIGAYSSLENAKKACKTGYSVFDANGVNIYTSKTTASAVPFKIKVAISDLNIRKGPGTNYARTKYIPVGVYTIIEVQSGTGSDKGWGRLKSGAGWISLDFCTKV